MLSFCLLYTSIVPAKIFSPSSTDRYARIGKLKDFLSPFEFSTKILGVRFLSFDSITTF